MKKNFNTGLSLTRAAMERMEAKKDGVLFTSALKKLVNMTPNALEKFLGKIQTIFGRLKKVVSGISLEATETFRLADFYKNKDQGGIFAYVDSDIHKWFDGEVKNSPAKELASYEFAEDITEENIIGDAKADEIYEEVDLAHISQVCHRHIIRGEKLLLEDGKANLFWVRNKSGGLCEVFVWLSVDGWEVSVREFGASLEWDLGGGSFFRNKR
ncbi:MAG: hypothetical protein WC662_04570 [Candidatus Paceibacterota bacterium]|jgi:hypothetical protein